MFRETHGDIKMIMYGALFEEATGIPCERDTEASCLVPWLRTALLVLV